MTLQEIKDALKAGKRVHWMNEGYDVILTGFGQTLIMCNRSEDCIGLTWNDGITLNGKESDFFIGE